MGIAHNSESPINQGITRVRVQDRVYHHEYCHILVSYKTTQHVGRATIEVGVREEEAIEDISRCRGRDGWAESKLPASRSSVCKRMYFASSIEEPRAK